MLAQNPPILSSTYLVENGFKKNKLDYVPIFFSKKNSHNDNHFTRPIHRCLLDIHVFGLKKLRIFSYSRSLPLPPSQSVRQNPFISNFMNELSKFMCRKWKLKNLLGNMTEEKMFDVCIIGAGVSGMLYIFIHKK